MLDSGLSPGFNSFTPVALLNLSIILILPFPHKRVLKGHKGQVFHHWKVLKKKNKNNRTRCCYVFLTSIRRNSGEGTSVCICYNMNCLVSWILIIRTELYKGSIFKWMIFSNGERQSDETHQLEKRSTLVCWWWYHTLNIFLLQHNPLYLTYTRLDSDWLTGVLGRTIIFP